MTRAPGVFQHEPVLIDDVIGSLKPRDGGRYIDGTLGAGGYTRAILDAANCRVWAIDRDPDAISNATDIVRQYAGRLKVMEGCFGEMAVLLPDHGQQVDGVTLDLGVSSMQLDDGSRGFSFRHDGPLDMRQGKCGRSAADVVNEADEAVLADIIYRYGEERQARRIARAISDVRANTLITRTSQLADIVRGAYRGRRDTATDPATKTFQAIRIEVNDELGELERGLRAAEIVLAPGGRLVLVSFHSLEDRIVKNFLRSRSGEKPAGSRHLPIHNTLISPPTFRLINRTVVKPSAAEIKHNPRSRSARLRVAERLAATDSGS
ncbi:MAG: 16S rRNA (cytosine(1402)-N(4))-methyltransferase RsmH [Pseudomonadota bacterium]|nr:16S rRNA (cytosine(1402)-N(4))-methyltransferase RsmH [Pseudomonadota bacterium]